MILSNEKPIPPQYRCALTNQLMKHPVRIYGSRVPVAYEKTALEDYFNHYGLEDPQTKHEIHEDVVATDVALQKKIEDFIHANPEFWHAPL
jgi:hypothetical protein